MPTQSDTLNVAEDTPPLTHCFWANALVLRYADPLSRFALMLTHPHFLDALSRLHPEVHYIYSINEEQGRFLKQRHREIILTYYLQIIKALTGIDHLLAPSPEHLEQTYKALIRNRKNDKLFNLIHATLNGQASGDVTARTAPGSLLSAACPRKVGSCLSSYVETLICFLMRYCKVIIWKLQTFWPR